MAKKMKCTNCGSKNLFGYRKQDSVAQNEDIFACKQCGHLEFFINENTIKMHLERVEQEIKYNKELEKFEEERAKLQKQLDDLNKIISDENQTVKNVNQAKEKIIELEEKINGLYPPVPF